MFSFFKKKSKLEVLQERYKKLAEETFELSKVSRAAGDKKYAEAEAVLAEIDLLRGETIKD
jgi:hypothetical protein